MDIPKETPEAFEGQIGHTMKGKRSSDVIVYIFPQMSELTMESVKASFATTTTPIRPLSPIHDLEIGRVYSVVWNGEYQRAWFLRYHNDDENEAEMALFDVGEKTVVKRTEILNCPPDVASWDVFGVICPFFMPDAAEDFLAVVISMLGSECRCVPDDIICEPGMMPCVTGELSLECRPGEFVSLKQVEQTSTGSCNQSAFTPVGRDQDSGMQLLSKLMSPVTTPPSRTSTPALGSYFSQVGQQNPWTDGFDGSHQYFSSNFGNKSHHLEQNNWYGDSNVQRRGGRGRSYSSGRGSGYGHRSGFSLSENDFGVGGELLEQAPPVSSSCFKEYEPSHFPTVVRVRFDREDPEAPRSQFWLLDPAILGAVEKVLNEGIERYSRLESMAHLPLRAVIGLGCLARVTERAYRVALRRGIVGGFSPQRNKYWVHLIDLGQFAWVRTLDMLQVSTLSKTDPILTIPVAMFRCRFLQPTSVRLQDLIRGVDYHVTVLTRCMDGVFIVQIAPGEMPIAVPTDRESALERMRANNDMLRAVNDGLIENLMQNLSVMEQSLSRNRPIGHLAVSNDFPRFHSPWQPFPAFGMPCVTPLPIAVPVPVATPLPSVTSSTHTCATTDLRATTDGFNAPTANSASNPLNLRIGWDEEASGELQNDSDDAGRISNSGGHDLRSNSPSRDAGAFRFRDGYWSGTGDAQHKRNFGAVGDRRTRANFRQRNNEASRFGGRDEDVLRFRRCDGGTQRWGGGDDESWRCRRNIDGTSRFRQRNDDTPMKFMRPDSGGSAVSFRRDRTTGGGLQAQFEFGGGSGYSSRFEPAQDDSKFDSGDFTLLGTGKSPSRTVHTVSSEWDLPPERAEKFGTNKADGKATKKPDGSNKGEDGESSLHTVHTVSSEWDLPPERAEKFAASEGERKAAKKPDGKKNEN
uniref:Tudor domain-containing protein n=1 Tax=Parascaris univalens TaxID=6257 RepID=A0A915BDN0_PARUN